MPNSPCGRSLVVLALGWNWGVATVARAAPQPVPAIASDTAAALFADDRFEEAAATAARRLAAAPEDPEALRVAGQVALLSQRLEDAQARLERLIALRPQDVGAHKLLAEALLRRERYAEAVPHLRAAGQEARARQCESLQEKGAYRLVGELQEVHVPFVFTDPLPFVKVRLNGGEEALFLIDTGAGLTVVDPELAARLSFPTFGQGSGVFAGGKEATFELARAASLAIGGAQLENVPVTLLSTAKWSAAAMGARVWGVLGTHVLQRFLATLDYPAQELVLRPRKGDWSPPPGAVEIPFWLAGDHLLLAWGEINGVRELMLVDTGLAGGAFTGPRSTLAAAGVKLDGPSQQGVGGGGKVNVTPFAVKSLALGSVVANQLLGIGGAFPEQLETSQGFRIGGLISHAFFRPYALTFDFQNRRLVLVRGTVAPARAGRTG